MSNIEYRAMNSSGELVTGSLEETSERAAARQLRKDGLTPLSFSLPQQKQLSRHDKRRASRGEVLLSLHQLTTLLKSGVPLDEAVNSLAESIEQYQLATEMKAILAKLRQGSSFSQALEESDIRLPSYIYQLVQSGELTGNLAGALYDGTQQLSYEQRINSELQTALIYPSILIFSGIAAVLLIFIVVVPKFVNLLDKSQGEIPLLARLVLGTGQFVNNNLLLLGIVIALAVVAGVAMFSNPKLRQSAWDQLMKMPLVGDWLIMADIGRWASMLATLLSSKIELTKALDLAQQGVSGSRLRANFSHVTKAVRSGSSLASALKESQSITATGYGLIKVGERSGELPAMLRSLSTLYIESGQERMKRFLTLLEPIAILAIGSVIGVIMTGIILAITSVNDIAF